MLRTFLLKLLIKSDFRSLSCSLPCCSSSVLWVVLLQVFSDSSYLTESFVLPKGWHYMLLSVYCCLQLTGSLHIVPHTYRCLLTVYVSAVWMGLIYQMYMINVLSLILIDHFRNDQMVYLSKTLIHIDQILNDQVDFVSAEHKLY